jgi:hypothetical protein
MLNFKGRFFAKRTGFRDRVQAIVTQVTERQYGTSFFLPIFTKIPFQTAKKGCHEGTPFGFISTLPRGKIEI